MKWFTVTSKYTKMRLVAGLRPDPSLQRSPRHLAGLQAKEREGGKREEGRKERGRTPMSEVY